MPLRSALIAIALLLWPLSTTAEVIRVASFNTEMQRDGPGLFLRDLNRGTDEDIAAVVDVVAQAAPDVLALQGIDWDFEQEALSALVELLNNAGLDYPFQFALMPNSGLASGLDLDGDGRLGGPGDAQGYGAFTGQGGIAVLSRFPIRAEEATDLSPLLWREMPDALLPQHEAGDPFPSPAALDVQRLSSTGHWIVPIELPDGTVFDLLTFQAGPPVFDGPEDRNGRRNHDEIVIWRFVWDGLYGPLAPRFVLAGGANLDPNDSDGRSEAIQALLSDPRISDPEPSSGGAAEAQDQGHRNDNALDTVDWSGPGRLRVDYVLPSAAGWTVAGSGVYWPKAGQDGHDLVSSASRHRLVWVDLIAD